MQGSMYFDDVSDKNLGEKIVWHVHLSWSCKVVDLKMLRMTH